MSTKQYTSIHDVLSDKRLVHSTQPSIDELAVSLAADKPIKLVYGETYDIYGPTLDSLKYYFVIALLHDLLEKEGVEATSSVIVGDLHSVKNKIVANKDSLLASADSRIDLIERIKSTYKLNFESLLMSKLFEGEAFKKRLDTIIPIFERSEGLQEIAKKTVLTNRLAQEEKAGFRYTLEEVALITGFDVKIGPPREQHYDKLARHMGKEVGNDDFRGLYLTPTYPLGLGFDYFVTHPEIEEFGLTPYKAGSNQLQANRIILGQTTRDECRKLIDESFISPNPILPNPVLDIYIIAQLAESFLNGEPFEIDDALSLNPQKLKETAYEKLILNIYKPLGLAS